MQKVAEERREEWKENSELRNIVKHHMAYNVFAYIVNKVVLAQQFLKKGTDVLASKNLNLHCELPFFFFCFNLSGVTTGCDRQGAKNAEFSFPIPATTSVNKYV